MELQPMAILTTTTMIRDSKLEEELERMEEHLECLRDIYEDTSFHEVGMCLRQRIINATIYTQEYYKELTGEYYQYEKRT